MNKAVISLGSNINPENNINKVKKILAQEQTLLCESKFVVTKPKGFQDQLDFINGALYIETKLNMQDLKKYLKDVEHRLGRLRTENKNGPRTIDLDVVVYNNSIIDNDFYRYDFVKEAVLELLPELKQILKL